MAEVVGIFALLNLFWTLIYIFYVISSGWIIVKGVRGLFPLYVKILLWLGFGFLSLFCALGLSAIIPLSGTGVFRIIFSITQINFIIAGMISTTILTLCVFLISSKFYNVKAIEKSIEKLNAKLEKAKSFERKMEKKSLVSKVMIPTRLAGIILIVAFVFIALYNFRGIPNMTDIIQNTTGNIISELGISQEDIRMFCKIIENSQYDEMPSGCIGPIELIQSLNETSPDKILNILSKTPVYVDSSIESLIESNSG
ncbi:MAG: hypothetical protein QXN71_03230, partial [Candidatus Aenigmatarchaeota archaeon]